MYVAISCPNAGTAVQQWQIRGSELAKFVIYLGQQLDELHFFWGALLLPCGYLARSARLFLTSSGLFVAVYSPSGRSRWKLSNGILNAPNAVARI